MECPGAADLQAFVEGHIDPAGRADIDRHVAGCALCRDVAALAAPEGDEPGDRLAAGSRIGHFIVEKVIGIGGMGVVYAARDPDLDRRVALKLLREESPVRRERLAREAQALARIPSPNVCAVYEIGDHRGRLFIAMELVVGWTLGLWARGRTWREVAAAMAAAARGVSAAHAVGVIHRDFKPDNVLVGDDGRVRVSDFGLASWRGEAMESTPSGSSPMTQTGAIMGTPLYMAPEQHQGARADEKSDQWSFAATLYEMLHGRLPFSGVTEAQIAQAKCDGQILPGRIKVPGWLDRLVRRGLSPDPEGRLPSMAAFASALERRPGRRLGLWAVAAIALVLAGGFVVRSRGNDLELARLAALAEKMEADLRVEKLAPPHDMRPARAKVRAEVDKLRAQTSPAAEFALGKGLELLGDDAGARSVYERAWADGYRTPRAAEGLGTVLARLDIAAERKARLSLAGQALEDRLAAIRDEIAAPAMKGLEASGAALARGQIALLAGDYVGARKLAAEALTADPGHYEAHALAAEAWRSEASALHSDESRAPLDLLAHAADSAENAVRWARSDPEMALVLVGIREAILASYARLGERADPALASLDSAIAAAAVLDPDSPRLLLARARLLRIRGDIEVDNDPRGALPLFEQAVALLRPAPAPDVETLIERARILGKWSRARSMVKDGNDVDSLIDEGLAALAQARAREPEDPAIARNAQILLHNKAWAEYQRHDIDGFARDMNRAMAEGDEVIRRGSTSRMAARLQSASDLIQLSDVAWKKGRDPRPDVHRAIALLVASKSDLNEQSALVSDFLVGMVNAAEVLLRTGDDPGPAIADGVAMADATVGREPGLILLKEYKGLLVRWNAWRRLAAGEDPTPSVTEAVALLEAAASQTDHAQADDGIASALIAGVRWRIGHGQPPGAALERACRLGDGTGSDEIRMECALEAARWAQRSGGDARPDARRGLEIVNRALGEDAADPDGWIAKSSLEALAGDLTAARASYAHALAVNPLVAGSFQAKEAAAALEGSAYP